MNKLDLWMKKYRTRISGVLAVILLVLSKPSPLTLLWGAIPVMAGQGIRIWSSGYIHKNEVLSVQGPYSLSRNPLYVGSFIMGAGFMVAMGVVLFAVVYLVFFAVVYWFTIRWEEDKLARKFPDEWEGYRNAVPRFTPFLSIPKFRAGEFSWAQVRKHREVLNASVVVAVYVLLWVKAMVMGNA